MGYLLLSMEEASAVKRMGGKEPTAVDYKFICDEDKENRFSQSNGSKYEKMKICSVCYFTSPDVMTCKGCNMADYCSETCQRKDWPTHLKNCQKFPKKNRKKNGEKPKEDERAQKDEMPKNKNDETSKKNGTFNRNKNLRLRNKKYQSEH